MPSPPSLPADLPSAKVRPPDRIGVDGWLKFHAAYSKSFAAAAVKAIAKPGELVVDPFCGSGTTARAAGGIGARCLTVDLNPALVALSRATLLTPEAAKSVREVLKSGRGSRSAREPVVGSLRDTWFHPATVAELDGWRSAFESLPSTNARAFGRGLLVRAAREIVKPDVGTNPTWPKPPLRRIERDVRSILLRVAEDMTQDLSTAYLGLQSHNLKVRVGDARALPLPDASADAALTSPPYLSRIDYIRATLPELLALGFDDEPKISKLRAEIMGGVLALRRADDDSARWGPLTKEVLELIRSHESKASKSYYTILARQYFADLDASLAELVRVLKPGARGMIVVQTSYYKNVPIPLPAIIVEMIEASGASAKILQSEGVSQHYGHLSPHQRGYVRKKVLDEAIILIHR